MCCPKLTKWFYSIFSGVIDKSCYDLVDETLEHIIRMRFSKKRHKSCDKRKNWNSMEPVKGRYIDKCIFFLIFT